MLVMMSDCAESHKVTIELDYTHFTKPDGWSKIVQIVRTYHSL